MPNLVLFSEKKLAKNVSVQETLVSFNRYFLNPDPNMKTIKIVNKCLARGNVEDESAKDYGLGMKRECLEVRACHVRTHTLTLMCPALTRAMASHLSRT